MSADDRAIDALLESVAAGQPVDWDGAVARAAGEERTRVAALRDVARVADFHRVLQRDVAGPEAGPREIERWGALLLLERVGAGGGGDVWRAWDPALQREVALKLLRPRGSAAEATSWLEEGRALARVRDPHVVTVHGAAEHGGRAGLWMEFLHGPTLAAEIARRGALPAADVARLGVELGRALAAVHAAGALHGDVKPSNVILARDGSAVLTDFGLGRRDARGPGAGADAFSGTPMFMSPQRLAGAVAREGDDLYALGVTLWFALVGRPPFAATSVDELRAALAAGQARPLRLERPEAPPALVAAIERAMAREPVDRFDSARALAGSFAALAQAADARPARHSRLLLAGVAAGLVVVAIAAWLLTSRAPDREAAVPAAPAPVGGPPLYDVSASFLRRGADGDDRLHTGDRVGPGDLLSLEFRTTRPTWVYVLNADDRGETYLLFPQPLFDQTNPLPADTTLLLPGRRGGRESAWTVTSRGGREHLLVVANPGPLAELEAELRRLPAPRPGQAVSYARVPTATIERLRGIGGVSDLPAPPDPAGPGAVFERIRTLASAEQGVRGLWVRQVVLDNPR